MTESSSRPTHVYVGTFTRAEPHGRGAAEGVYVCRFDASSGAMTLIQSVPDVSNPSFLALHPNQRYLYAVNAVPEIDGQAGGGLSALAIDGETGELRVLNRQSTRGAGPCHVSVDRSGRYAMAANYTGGSVAVFPIQDDGSLAPASDFIQHVGSSVDPRRQEAPHAHSINPDLEHRNVLVCDLGMDQVLTYRLDRATGRLIAGEPSSVQARAGAGPRHLDYHPNGRFVYVINEINSTITAYTYDAESGRLDEVQTVPTLPDGFTGSSTCADIHVAPSGRFVYGSNRGHDSLVIFAVDEQTGKLDYVGHESTRGKTPRNFAITPAGDLLLAANQDTDNIVVFQVDQQTGKLKPTGQQVEIPTPVCLKFATLSR
jgi:6-phosphogluconolactonase